MSSYDLTPRQDLSEDVIAAALDECAKEPIHIPGSIQPHGFLLAVDRETLLVCQVSSNISDLLEKSPQDCLGCHLEALLDPEQCSTLLGSATKQALQPLSSAELEINGGNYDVAAHYSRELLIIELERKDPLSNRPQDESGFFDNLRRFSVHLRNATGLQTLYEFVVESIQELTGFGRTKLYIFDQDWNGTVAAEARVPQMPSYLGLRFPASDIPPQARKLYSMNYLRFIADIRYQPVPLYPAELSGRPTDLSLSVLRSVSPVHIQYLANMDVMASMSISIFQNEKLWGMIVCHHNAPMQVPYRVRNLAEIMGHIFSAQLSTLQIQEQRERAVLKSLQLEKINGMLAPPSDWKDAMAHHSGEVLSALDADAFVVIHDGVFTQFGSLEPLRFPDGLERFLAGSLRDGFLACDDAHRLFKSQGWDQPVFGGFLVVAVSSQHDTLLLWIRKEQKASVNWAGNPEKPLDKTVAGYRLTPRSSFNLWQTTVEGKCSAWTEQEVSHGRAIAQMVLDNEKVMAEQANIAKSEFLANMSHELRTPMGAVIGIARILLEEKGLTAHQQNLLQTLDTSASNLLELINDLLDISKIEAGELELESEPFSPSGVIEEVRSLMLVKAQEKKIQLNVSYGADANGSFLGDAHKLRQILLNLVSNALKFTPEGFVNVLANLTPGAEQGETILSVEVSDTGIGIVESRLVRIFDKFVQADASTSRKYGGTGLGLAISQNLAQLMGGRISVISTEGMGSKFTLRVPLRSVEPAEQPVTKKIEALTPPRKRVRRSKRVLLVEDYEGNVVVALLYLQKYNFDVVVASNGQEAIDRLATENFDCVLMDVQMPIKDGYTATREIRAAQASGELAPCPIIGMTANAYVEDREKCLSVGMDDYISKPIQLEQLLSKVEAAIQDYEGRSA